MGSRIVHLQTACLDIFWLEYTAQMWVIACCADRQAQNPLHPMPYLAPETHDKKGSKISTNCFCSMPFTIITDHYF